MKRDINDEIKEPSNQFHSEEKTDRENPSLSATPFGVLDLVRSGQNEVLQSDSAEKNSEGSEGKSSEIISENTDTKSKNVEEKKTDGEEKTTDISEINGEQREQSETSMNIQAGKAEGEESVGEELLKKKVQIEKKVIEILKTVYDPEIPVNIYELGLVYNVRIDDQMKVEVEMTLTSPTCPVAGSLPGEVEEKLKSIEGVRDAAVILVWDPPWNPEMMSEAARLELGFFF